MKTTAKTYEFPVDVRWLHGKRTMASVAGKDDLEVATPPEFQDGVEGVWSPEDLFVGSIATCYAVTLAGMARRGGVPLGALSVGGTGVVTQRKDGRFGFTDVTLHVDLTTDEGFTEAATEVAHAAEASCLVAASVDLPVHVDLSVHAPLLLAAAR